MSHANLLEINETKVRNKGFDISKIYSSVRSSVLKFMRELVKIFNISLVEPIRTYKDNSGSKNIATYYNLMKNSKRNGIHYHYLHEFVKENIINVIKVNSVNNIADIFTKPLCKEKIRKFGKLMNVT